MSYFVVYLYVSRSGSMAESSQLMPLINTGNYMYRGGTNDKPGPTI